MRDSLWFFLLILLFSRVFFIFHFELEERTKGFGEGQIKGGEERVGNWLVGSFSFQEGKRRSARRGLHVCLILHSL